MQFILELDLHQMKNSPQLKWKKSTLKLGVGHNFSKVFNSREAIMAIFQTILNVSYTMLVY